MMPPSALPPIARRVRDRDGGTRVLAQKLLPPRRLIDVPLAGALVALVLI